MIISSDVFSKGKFQSLNKYAKFYKVPYSTLYIIVNTNSEFCGSGKSSNVLTKDEEQLVTGHVMWRESVGCGLTWLGLQKLIQEILIAAKESNSQRVKISVFLFDLTIVEDYRYFGTFWTFSHY